ncbi:MAG: dTDP-4-dehydrorhamnose reductase [Phycisphaerae bacterium]|nr:dTDP-4-dehydrorhamnose reductase [Phycisphaerae bacterium]
MPGSSAFQDQDRPVLLLGATGMLGRAWSRLLDQHEITWFGPSRNELDFQDPRLLNNVAVENYSILINCVAWTDVDGAEDHESEANTINNEAAARLARRCEQTNTKMVHYSTDYVFSGDDQKPYKVLDPISPQNAYGRTKASSESSIYEVNREALTIRTSWLYAPWGKNFVRTMLHLATERESLQVVNDQIGTPTDCQHLAELSFNLLQKGQRGIWHITDGGSCTWFDFARTAISLAGLNCTVHPCESSAYPTKAKRPRYSVLNVQETEEICGPFPGWERNLKRVIAQMEHPHVK